MKLDNSNINAQGFVTNASNVKYSFYVSGGTDYNIKYSDSMFTLEPTADLSNTRTQVQANEENLAVDTGNELVVIADINTAKSYGLEIDGVVIVNVVELD